MNKSLLWLIVVVVIIVAGGIYLKNLKDSAPSLDVVVTENETLANVVPATGNIDDAVKAILNEVAQINLTPEETDPSLIEADTDIIDSFDQSFGDDQF